MPAHAIIKSTGSTAAAVACGNCLQQLLSRQVASAAAIETRNLAQASTHDAAPISNNSCGIIVSV
jgi:hypothetical protein